MASIAKGKQTKKKEFVLFSLLQSRPHLFVVSIAKGEDKHEREKEFLFFSHPSIEAANVPRLTLICRELVSRMIVKGPLQPTFQDIADPLTSCRASCEADEASSVHKRTLSF